MSTKICKMNFKDSDFIKNKTYFIFFIVVVFVNLSSLIAQPNFAVRRSLVNAVDEAKNYLDYDNAPNAIIVLINAIDSSDETIDKSDALFLLSNILFLEGRYDLLIESTNKFLWLYSKDFRSSDMAFLKGIGCYLTKKFDNAKEMFNKTISLNVNRVGESYYWKARMFVEDLNYDSIQFYIDKSIELSPHQYSDYALYLSGWLNEFRNKNDTAAALYRVLLRDYESSPLISDAQIRLAIIEGRRGSYNSAFELLDSLLPQGERQKEERLFMLGELASSLENYNDVIKFRKLFVKNYPSSRRIRPTIYSLAWGYLKTQKFDSSLIYFTKLQNDKDSLALASNYQIATLKLVTGDTISAIKGYENLIYKYSNGAFTDNAYYQLGSIFYVRKMYDSTRHYLFYLTKQFPKSEIRPKAQYLLAESYSQLNDPNNAYYAFARVRKIDSNSELVMKSLYREGIMLYRSGRFRTASDRFREYLEKYPKGNDIPQATYWLADAVFMTGSFKESELYFRSYLNNYKDGDKNQDALFGLGWSLFKQKNIKESSNTFLEFITKYPRSPQNVEATIRLADCKKILGEPDSALELYKKAIILASLGTQNEESRFRYAEILLQLNDTNTAIESIRELIKDYPNSPRKELYFINIATIYKNSNQDSLSINELSNFIKNYPQSNLIPQAYLISGDAFFNQMKYNSSLAYYDSILIKYPLSYVVPEALDGARYSLEKMGLNQEALAVIDSFEVRNPNRIAGDSLLYKRALILIEQGNYPEGIGACRRLEQNFIKSELIPEAKLLSARGFLNWQKPDTAYNIYQSVLDSFPNSNARFDALVEQSNILSKNERWTEIILKLDTLCRKNKTYNKLPEAKFILAKSYLQSGDSASALFHFNSVLELKKIFDMNILNDTSTIDSGRIDDDLFLTNKEDANLDYYTDRSRNAIARILSKQNKIDTALTLTRIVISRRLDDAAVEAYIVNSEILFLNRDYITAITQLKRLQREFIGYPDSVEPSYLLMGSCYEKLGEIISAREVYNKLLLITKNDKLKIETNLRLKKLKKK